MATLKKTSNRRGGHRARVRALINKINNELANDNPDKNLLESLSAEIKSQHTLLLKLDEEIVDLIDESEVSCDIEQASEFNMTLNSCQRNVGKYLSAAVKLQESARSVKLPNIVLKKFDGNPLEWPAFFDLFKTSIHERTDIASPAKFHYLSSSLVGDAALLLAGFDHTAGQYEEAVDLLQETYGKPKLLIRARLHALLDLTTPLPTSTDISRFRSQYESHLRGLKSLGCNVTDAGYIYATLLLRKLPKKIADNINRASKNDVWDLEALRKAIDNEIEHLRAYGSDTVETTSHGNGNPGNISTVSYSISNTNSKETKKDLKCQFCAGKHLCFNCVEFKTVQAKRDRAKNLKLCYNCLRNNHMVSSCSNPSCCKICRKRHHSSLCTQNEDSDKAKVFNKQKNNGAATKNDSSTMTVFGSDSGNLLDSSCILPTARLSLTNNEITQVFTALFDTGSQRTFVLDSTAQIMKLNVLGYGSLSIDGFGSSIDVKQYPIVELNVNTFSEVVKCRAFVVNKQFLSQRLTMIGRSSLVNKLKSKGLTLADPTERDLCDDLSIIIGVDHYFSFVPSQQIDDNLFIIPSKVGTLIAGTIPAAHNVVSNITTVLKVATSDIPNDLNSVDASTSLVDLNNTLKQFWELDSIGISDPMDHGKDPTLLNFESSVRYENGKYIASLPWKNDHPTLPTNYDLVYKRLISLLSSLRKNPKNLLIYDTIIREQLKAEFIEEVSEIDNNCDYKMHYLAHHPVFKDSVTTPLRIVFDCSAKKSKYSPSLNECLYSGPSLINDLCSVLLRFRLGKYACVADISKAFLQVGLSEGDRNSTRFLWPVDPLDPDSPIVTYRFRVVLFGSTCSQFLLNATVLYHLKNVDNDCARDLSRNIYVDNIQNTFDTESDTIKFYHDSKNIMSNAGFPLREWNTNSTVLSKIMYSNADACSKKGNDVGVLGMRWNVKTDTLSLTNVSYANKIVTTKRHVTSVIAKLFDPLGIFLPVSIRGRIFIQKLWKSNLSWDEKLPSHLIEEWNNLALDLSVASNVVLPRQVEIRGNVVLNIFSDASKSAYGAVAYLTSDAGSIFLYSKARVVPLKSPTLPQLELTALTLAARLADFLRLTFSKEISFSRIILWTDSTIALSWLNTNKPVKPYVRQRVNEICALLPSAEFYHVKGECNPADYITRGISSKKLSGLKLWFQGPEWLQGFSSSLRLSINPINCLSLIEAEKCVPCNIVNARNSNEFPLDINRYSSLDKTVRILCYVRKFIELLKVGKRCADKSIVVPVPTVREFSSSELLLIRNCQEGSYSEIVQYFTSDLNSVTPKLVNQMGLVYENSIIKCRGRLENSDSPIDSKLPILLPTDSYLTKLIILDIHFKRKHSGVNDVLAALRERFWVPKGRQLIKSIIRNCVICRKVQGKNFKSREFAPLPYERVTQARPFEVVGLDYSGALNVRDSGTLVKVYICLFTCAVSRAVHLEIVENLTEEEFLSAFIRFVSRRSLPKIIISDNASTFVCASKTLKTISDKATIQNYLHSRGVEWKFITKRAPWTGGFYERMIGLTKSSLKKMLGKNLVSLKNLRTIIVEIEAGLNDRPITFVSNDIDDINPLTPSQLMCGHRLDAIPLYINPEELIDPSYNEKNILTSQLTKCSLLLEQFWKRWRIEYLAALRERHKNIVKGTPDDVSVGQIVLIGDDVPRVRWKLGLIIELLKCRDGIVRSVNLRTDSGTLNRAVSKLYPLEVYSNETCLPSYKKSIPEIREKLPIREAARKAKAKISSIYEE